MKTGSMRWAELRAALQGDYWRAESAELIVTAWEQSGETLTAFARRHGVRPNRLAHWRDRLRKTRGPARLRFHLAKVREILTLMAGQLPVASWHEAIGDQTLADAISGRLIHRAHKILLKAKGLLQRELRAKRERSATGGPEVSEGLRISGGTRVRRSGRSPDSDLPAIVAPEAAGGVAGELTPIEPAVTKQIAGTSPLGAGAATVLSSIRSRKSPAGSSFRSDERSRSGHHGRNWKPDLTGGTHTRGPALRRVAAFVRVMWPESIGMGGRFPSDQAAGIVGTTARGGRFRRHQRGPEPKRPPVGPRISVPRAVTGPILRPMAGCIQLTTSRMSITWYVTCKSGLDKHLSTLFHKGGASL